MEIMREGCKFVPNTRARRPIPAGFGEEAGFRAMSLGQLGRQMAANPDGKGIQVFQAHVVVKIVANSPSHDRGIDGIKIVKESPLSHAAWGENAPGAESLKGRQIFRSWILSENSFGDPLDCRFSDLVVVQPRVGGCLGCIGRPTRRAALHQSANGSNVLADKIFPTLVPVLRNEF